MRLIFVDCEASGPAPVCGRMTEFGAADYETGETFHGHDDSKETALAFEQWLSLRPDPVFVSDNNGFDWQWINHMFWQHVGRNPFGHSSRRISDFYAGLRGDFRKTQQWKRLRVTKHDHNPVHDAVGNVEAFRRMINGER